MLMPGLVIEREVLIEAPTEVVWRAITEPDQMSLWFADRVDLVVEPFSRQAVSEHLVVLGQAGLISRRKQGREVLYQVQADRLDQAARAMSDLAAQWDRRLGAIKRLAEAAYAEAKKKGDSHDR
jgi:DNA-binding transcriptional ArsR family regulator